jgi:hypothetical protein
LTALGMVAGLDQETVARLSVVAFDRVIHCERTATGSLLRSGVLRRVGDRLEMTR